MISTLKLRSGRSAGQPGQSFEAAPITVFVGPNNSGKSRVLSEILQVCSSGSAQAGSLVLDSLTFSTMTGSEAAEAIARVEVSLAPNESLEPGYVMVGRGRDRQRVNRDALVEALTQGRRDLLSQSYLKFRTLMMDGPSRIGLVQPQNAGDLQAQPQSSFQTLFRDDNRRSEVRRIIHDAFGSYFVLDPTQLGQLRIRLSDVPPTHPTEERGVHDAAVRFHSKAQLIQLASDGVKAFTGIITEVIAGDPSVLLIDEPEAFLHPSLAFKLGKEIAVAANASHKRVLVATHSPDFVMGCLQSGTAVNIVRLTYRGGISTARLLPNASIIRLIRNPLLRSTGILSGLFYEFVVVTESDTDRAFYQEVNERLLRFEPSRGIPNALFLNAQNKQTVRTIVAPLRELGIPAAAIVDVDVLKDGGSVWTDLLTSAGVPRPEHQALGVVRHNLKTAFESSGKDMKRDGGLAILKGADAETASNLFDKLSEYGIFVVRGGELESWLKPLGVTGHGPAWLIDVFERMGEDPEAAGYVRPDSSDVWRFLDEIRSWSVNVNRKGIPG